MPNNAPQYDTMTNDYLPTETDNETVLVAEDDPNVAELIKMVLTANGYHAICASDGFEALKLFTAGEHNFCVVLADLQLPGLNGLGLLRAVRMRDPNVAMVVASGRLEDETLDQLMAINVTAFLNKPYTIAQLLDTKTLVCGHRKDRVLAA